VQLVSLTFDRIIVTLVDFSRYFRSDLTIMVAARFVFLAAAVSVVASLTEENVFTTLLKRQEPGTPEYNCHDNCGKKRPPAAIDL
jgi:hypothetical protein